MPLWTPCITLVFESAWCFAHRLIPPEFPGTDKRRRLKMDYQIKIMTGVGVLIAVGMIQLINFVFA